MLASKWAALRSSWKTLWAICGREWNSLWPCGRVCTNLATCVKRMENGIWLFMLYCLAGWQISIWNACKTHNKSVFTLLRRYMVVYWVCNEGNICNHKAHIQGFIQTLNQTLTLKPCPPVNTHKKTITLPTTEIQPRKLLFLLLLFMLARVNEYSLTFVAGWQQYRHESTSYKYIFKFNMKYYFH
jgi:hypothetical protein